MRRRIGRSVLPVIAGAVAIWGVAATAVPAAAAVPFQTATFCTAEPGVSVTTNGSSFQYNGVSANATTWNGGTPCGGAANGFGTVNVAKGGSGLCIGEMTGHSSAAQLCGTDVPYTDTAWANMQAGAGTNASPVATIPLAAGAVGVSYSGCMANGIKLTGAQISQIFSSPTGTVDASLFDPAHCASGSFLQTLVRSVSSGTTAIFKTYLFQKAAASSPASNPWAVPPDSSTSWPAPTNTTTCTAYTNNSDLANCLKANPTLNLITYIDQSDVNAQGLNTASVPNGSESAAAAVNPYSQPAPGGCTNAAAAAPAPPSASADWAHVFITNSPAGYGICGLTYALAFVAPVQAGVSTAAQAAVVRDFLSYEVSDAGQAAFASNRYDALPQNLQAIAVAGAAALTTN